MIESSKYVYPTNAEISKEQEHLKKHLLDFCEFSNISMDEVDINDEILEDVIIRVDKRVSYYLAFHNISVNEYKKTAIYIYWINKLSPFLYNNTSNDKKELRNAFNEKFCIFLLFSLLTGFKCHELMGEVAIEEYLNELEYALRFRNLSQDSLILALAPFYHFSVHTSPDK